MLSSHRGKFNLLQELNFVSCSSAKAPGPSCSKPILANPGLVKNFNLYLTTAKGGFFTRLRFKEKKFVIYITLLTHNFVANLPLAVNKWQLKFTLT